MLELWFDFSCPYAYLASRRVRTLGVEVDWRPMLLGGVFRGSGAGDGPMATLSAAKAAHNAADMHRWAAQFDVPFRIPPGHPMRTVRALRTLLGLPRPAWPAAIDAIYAAYWQRGEDITSDAVLGAALRDTVDAATLAAAFAAADGDAVKAELRRRTDEALALGIFGAPAWVLRQTDVTASRDISPPTPATAGGARGLSGGALSEREREPTLIWGQDRMAWVEAALAGWDPDAGSPPGGPRPLVAPPAVPGAEVDVYYDVASPFAYLALTQLPALAASGARVRLVPILLGGLFRDIGQHDVPLLAFPPAKMRYVQRELARWGRWWGVPFAMPAKFPQRTVAAQRLALLADVDALALAAALGRAMWADGRDLEDEATLRAILEATGHPASLLDRTREPDVKARLVANTTAARDAGVFGVPTFVTRTAIGTRLFWGQDRLDMVARTLAGWPAPGL